MTRDYLLLERAYLSIHKKVPGPEPTATADPFPEETDVFDPELGSELDAIPKSSAVISDEVDFAPDEDQVGAEEQEQELTKANIRSVADDIAKICDCVCSGKHLEPWAQQNIAVAMDKIAEVARRCCL